MPEAITPTIVSGIRESGGRKASVRSASFVIIVVLVCSPVGILRSQVSVTDLNEKYLSSMSTATSAPDGDVSINPSVVLDFSISQPNCS